jgi:hypothetical protein
MKVTENFVSLQTIVPQHADEWSASNMGGICEYTEYVVAESRQGVLL